MLYYILFILNRLYAEIANVPFHEVKCSRIHNICNLVQLMGVLKIFLEAVEAFKDNGFKLSKRSAHL